MKGSKSLVNQVGGPASRHFDSVGWIQESLLLKAVPGARCLVRGSQSPLTGPLTSVHSAHPVPARSPHAVPEACGVLLFHMDKVQARVRGDEGSSLPLWLPLRSLSLLLTVLQPDWSSRSFWNTPLFPSTRPLLWLFLSLFFWLLLTIQVSTVSTSSQRPSRSVLPAVTPSRSTRMTPQLFHGANSNVGGFHFFLCAVSSVDCEHQHDRNRVCLYLSHVPSTAPGTSRHLDHAEKGG